MFGGTEDFSRKFLKTVVIRLAGGIARAREMREICESEAFFQLDRQMHMSD